MSSPHRRPTGPTSLGEALRRTGVRLVAALAGATVVIVVAMATLPQFTNNNHDVRGASAGPTDRVVRLISHHHCWTGTAPKDVIPGHAVVTLPGHRARLVPADRGFAIWLDGAPGVLHAFCP